MVGIENYRATEVTVRHAEQSLPVARSRPGSGRPALVEDDPYACLPNAYNPGARLFVGKRKVRTDGKGTIVAVCRG
jgi:hypothetical protein